MHERKLSFSRAFSHSADVCFQACPQNLGSNKLLQNFSVAWTFSGGQQWHCKCPAPEVSGWGSRGWIQLFSSPWPIQSYSDFEVCIGFLWESHVGRVILAWVRLLVSQLVWSHRHYCTLNILSLVWLPCKLGESILTCLFLLSSQQDLGNKEEVSLLF